MGCFASKDPVVIDMKIDDSRWGRKKEYLKSNESLEENGFHPVSQLGKGAWGKVFLVKRPAQNGEDGLETSPELVLAAKIVPKNTHMTWDGIQRAPKVERLRDEVRALVATRGQRHCLKLMGVLESPQELTLLVDNVDGGDVLQYIMRGGSERGKAFDEATAATLVSQLLDAIAHCHDKGVVHRDVKPDNCLINKAHSKLTLCDFGSATMWHGATAMAQEDPPIKGECGSPFYAAPEVNFGNSGYNNRCDVFSAAITSFVIVAGFPKDREYFWSRILEGLGVRMLAGTAKDSLAESYWAFLDRALTKDPAQRPEAQDLLDDSTSWLWTVKGGGSVLDVSMHGDYLRAKEVARQVVFVVVASLSSTEVSDLLSALNTLTALTSPSSRAVSRMTPPDAMSSSGGYLSGNGLREVSEPSMDDSISAKLKKHLVKGGALLTCLRNLGHEVLANRAGDVIRAAGLTQSDTLDLTYLFKAHRHASSISSPTSPSEAKDENQSTPSNFVCPLGGGVAASPLTSSSGMKRSHHSSPNLEALALDISDNSQEASPGTARSIDENSAVLF
mmetsp:Transcript_68222/g.137222  ORF Transcript_68222/g.137222 Transcript_68222/m.137222 type:complete len:560 (-) Transcript_68222:101-1780(-)